MLNFVMHFTKDQYPFTWEDVSIVSLPRGEDLSVTQSNWTEWTSTGKQASPL